jgi:hypothetical protein
MFFLGFPSHFPELKAPSLIAFAYEKRAGSWVHALRDHESYHSLDRLETGPTPLGRY